ncbi:hypothetical protein SSX86_023083 [Deinandra increscens subsp. villosa]|uniref:RRM domain-containing protein n=1 Tax=Deinandra increscens subsp. villosa TaxID=3103831 RepID=A0AAP0GPL5_9ASTR
MERRDFRWGNERTGYGGNRRTGEQDQGWKTVSYRRQTKEAEQVTTTFFVADLPNGCTSEYLWKSFCHLGKISDAFVPRRRDWRGRVFGFIRFREVGNVQAMLEALRQIRVDGARTRVYISRFGKSREHGVGTVNKHEVVGGNLERDKKMENVGRGIGVNGSPVGNSGGQRNWIARNGENTVGGRRLIKIPYKPAFIPSNCSRRTLVGEIRFLELMEDMKNELNCMGELVVSYIGGIKFLLTFKDGDSANSFLSSQEEQWSRIFSSLKWWDGREQETERLTRLKIMGVPIMARDGDTFNMIAETFGRRVSSSEFSWADDDISSGGCFILTEKLGWIDEVVDVEWCNRRYAVWITEEGSPMPCPLLRDKPTPSEPRRRNDDNDQRGGAWRRPNDEGCLNSSMGSSNEVPTNKMKEDDAREAKGCDGKCVSLGVTNEDRSRVPNSVVTGQENNQHSNQTGKEPGGLGSKKACESTGLKTHEGVNGPEHDGTQTGPCVGNLGPNVKEMSRPLPGINVGLEKNNRDQEKRTPNSCGANDDIQADGINKNSEQMVEDLRRNKHEGCCHHDNLNSSEDEDEDTWDDGGFASYPTFRRAKKGIKWARAENIRLQSRMMRGGGKSAIWGQLSRAQSASSSRTQSMEFGSSVSIGKSGRRLGKETRQTVEAGIAVGIGMEGFEEEVTNLIRDEEINEETMIEDVDSVPVDKFWNRNFLDKWPGANVTALPREHSDHCPLVLDIGKIDYGPVPFKCFNSWYNREGFEETVRLAYALAPFDTRPDRKIQLKLQAIKKDLKKWWAETKKEEDKELKELKVKLDGLETAAESRALLGGEKEDRLEWKKRIKDLEQMAISDIKQKAKVKWAVDGDENSKFFHGVVNARMANNKISGLLVDGEWCMVPSRVGGTMKGMGWAKLWAVMAGGVGTWGLLGDYGLGLGCTRMLMGLVWVIEGYITGRRLAYK